MRLYKTCNGCTVGRDTYCYLGTGHSRRWAQEGNCSPIEERKRTIGKDKNNIRIIEYYYICDLGFEIELIPEKNNIETMLKSKTPNTCMYKPKEPCFKPKNFKEISKSLKPYN